MAHKEISLKSPTITHNLSKISHCECRKLLFSFANVLRKQLVAQGMDSARVLESIQLAMKEFGPESFAINQECMHLVQETLENFLNAQDKGGDILGRILVHFIFEAPGGKRLVHAEGSEEDALARREFTPGVIPRPLMRYFLICIRGTVNGVDPFQSLPVLFGSDFKFIEECTATALELANDYRMVEDSEDSPIYFPGFFLDRRVQVFAVELLGKVWQRLEDLPEDWLLRILHNLHSKRRKTVSSIDMERHFTLEDVRQLREAVQQGLAALQRGLQCDVSASRT